MSDTCTILEACAHKDIPSCTPVINVNDITPLVSIHLPDSRCCHFQLFQVDSVLPDICELKIVNKITRRGNRPWLIVNSKYLNLSAGQHLYRLSFLDTHTDDVHYYYVSFIIQNDDPEKPYIYMNRGTK